MERIDLCEPIGGRVLIKLDIPPKEQKGLVMQDPDKGYLYVGDVAQIGPGYLHYDGRRDKIEIQIGDKVVIKKFAGIEVRLNGEDFLMCFLDDVQGVVHALN